MLPALKGRPPLQPRIEALERRVELLERQIAEMVLPVAVAAKGYTPLFNRWPGNGST